MLQVSVGHIKIIRPSYQYFPFLLSGLDFNEKIDSLHHCKEDDDYPLSHVYFIDSIGDKGALRLAGALHTTECPVVILNLYDNRIGNVGVSSICKSLRNISYTLEGIDLRWNKIGDKGAARLSDALADKSYTRSLEKLYLDGNKLGNDGVQRLAEAIEINKESKIKVLHLSHNKIGDKGAISLAKMIEKNTTIKEMSLNSNRISDKGLRRLLEAVKKNTSIEKLDLRSNAALGKREVKSSMDRNVQTEQLKFSTNQNTTAVGENTHENNSFSSFESNNSRTIFLR
uniref:Uncharacterized protein n=1 Tax=Chaetoceros debilis TaxID=122233 RepID=A0A7S3PVQ9_9STRA